MTKRPLKRFYWRDSNGRFHWSRVLPGVKIYAVRGSKWEPCGGYIATAEQMDDIRAAIAASGRRVPRYP